MEKAYQRINWVNGRESLDTPLNDDNLNLMDIALNTIDNRVVTLDSQVQTLQGYETRAAQSAAEASLSATDASNSATSALQSATSASQSASLASTSETNASASATSASQSATSASMSETNAATSESNASTSETNAHTSEVNASTSESNASQSEKNSEAWAVGQRNGVDVPSTDDTYHNNSKYYSEQASGSATSASTSSSSASASATLAESYAKGGTSSRTGEDTDNAKYYKERCEQIVSDLGYPIDPKGKCTFANLPAIADAQIGWMYQITDSFTPGNTFVTEDRGVLQAENTEVYLTSDNLWACMGGAGVLGVKGSAEQSYRQGQVNITKENIGLGNVPNVTTDNQTPTVSEAETRTNLAVGDTLSVIVGKIKKFFSDLKTVAFTGSYNDLTDTPVIPSTDNVVMHTAQTAVGSATQPVYVATDGTATACTYSVAKSVPSDAKFSDTTYPKAVKNITRSGTTFTATCYDNTTFTFTQQDNNTTTGTTYAAGSCPNNTTFGTNGSIKNVFDNLNGKLSLSSIQNIQFLWQGLAGDQRLEIIATLSAKVKILVQFKYNGTLTLYQTTDGGSNWQNIWTK